MPMPTKDKTLTTLQSQGSARTPSVASTVERLTEIGVVPAPASTSLSSEWLYLGEQRLDASHYASEALAANQALTDSGLPIKKLGSLVKDVFTLSRFRRIYASDEAYGWKYLSASEALTFRPTSDRYIAINYAPKEAQRHFAKAGWLLVSSSGTVGRCTVATERLSNFFLTHDLARIVPHDDSEFSGGYLYAYLSSSIGQALLTREQYGSAIKHLESHHIKSVPVPRLSGDEQKAIGDAILRAFELRDKANALFDDADALLHTELKVPRFDERLVPYLHKISPANDASLHMPHPRAFSVTATDVETRFDASYHVPIAKTAIGLMTGNGYDLVRLNEFAGKHNIRIPPRFKRIYVNQQFGIPFLRPSQLPQLRPYNRAYISKLTPALPALRLNSGEVLITTDGTVGRIGLVGSYLSGWAGSNNLARIVCDASTGDNGYLAAFLTSPYGYYQLTREIYGGVVDHIEENHIANVQIPDLPPAVRNEIGKLYVEANNYKDEATAVEERAIVSIEHRLYSSSAH